MTPEEIADALSAPFEANEVKFKPQSVKGNRALAICYIDARLVADRLDEVMGIDGWKTEYTQVGPCSVECRLSLKINGEWVGKADVGSVSEQPDEGDRMKAAYSDALKRAAVLWSVGRYIYRVPNCWCDYDPQKKQFTQKPQLPAWALPKKQPARPAPAPYAEPHAEPAHRSDQPQPTQADQLYDLLEQLAAVRGVPVADLVGTVVRKLDAKAASLDDLSPKALLDGVTSTRKRLAEERPKGQQTLAGAEPARGLPD
jgi:hypothetical protein